MTHTHDPYEVPAEFQAHILAQQVAPLQQQNTALQIEVAYLRQQLAERDATIAELQSPPVEGEGEPE